MLWILTVAVTVALILVVFNLTLSFAIVRRLRSAQAATSTHGHGGPGSVEVPPGPQMTLVAVGERVGQFSVTTLDGDLLTEADVATGDSTVVFLSATCSACEQVQEDLERRQDAFGQSLIVFVLGLERQAAAIGARLASARVARCAMQSDVTEAFGRVDGYPRVMRVTDGVIAAGGLTLDHLQGKHSFVASPA